MGVDEPERLDRPELELSLRLRLVYVVVEVVVVIVTLAIGMGAYMWPLRTIERVFIDVE